MSLYEKREPNKFPFFDAIENYFPSFFSTSSFDNFFVQKNQS